MQSQESWRSSAEGHSWWVVIFLSSLTTPLRDGSLLWVGLLGHFHILCFYISVLFEIFNHLYRRGNLTNTCITIYLNPLEILFLTRKKVRYVQSAGPGGTFETDLYSNYCSGPSPISFTKELVRNAESQSTPGTTDSKSAF